jgi:hypothetical protein
VGRSRPARRTYGHTQRILGDSVSARAFSIDPARRVLAGIKTDAAICECGIKSAHGALFRASPCCYAVLSTADRIVRQLRSVRTAIVA